MDYEQAEKLRKKSFGTLLAEQEGGLGSSLKSAISQKTQAKITGIKEKFDPMNIAKAVGGKAGAAIYGKVFGRDQKSMERFAGAKKKRDIGTKEHNVGIQHSSSASDVLGLIYRLMLRADEDKKLHSELEKNKLKEESDEENQRNAELIRALTGRKKAPSRKEKKAEKRAEKKAEKKVEKKEVKPKVEAKPKVEKAPEIKPKVEKAPTAKEVPKPEIKPTAAPSAKPSVTSTAAKVATTAVAATGIFASTDAFSKTMYPYAEKASKGLGGKIPAVAILGQWSGESGGGKSLPADFNYAGIKAGKNDKKGDYVLTEERYTDAQIKQAQASGETLHKVLGPQDKIKKKGKEVTVDEWFGKGAYNSALSEGKKWVQVKSYFAKFDDFDDFTNRYISFLSSPRYAKARSSTTPAEFGSEVAKAGYATASADKYSAKVASFADSFNNSGTKIDSTSKENKDLKNVNTDSPAPITKNTTNIQQSSSSSPKVQTGDDKNAYQKKAQG